MSSFFQNFKAGFNAAKEASKEAKIIKEKVSFTDPYESDQMLTFASLYALQNINDTQFRDLLSDREIEVELKGGWESCIVEPGYLIIEEGGAEHILLAHRADKKQQKQYADSRVLCTCSVPPVVIEDKKALKRYDMFFEYENLLKQLYSDRTTKSERRELLDDAVNTFYPAFKKEFSKDKKGPENQQPRNRQGEPELQKFKANGWRTLAGMLDVTVDDLAAMKPKARAKFLEDMQLAAENFSVRYEYLIKEVAQEAAKGTKDSEIWAALIWHFKKADPDKVDALNEMKEDGVKCATAAKLSGLSEDEVTDIVEKHRAWKENKDKKGKRGNGGNGRDQRKTPPHGGTGAGPAPKGPYAGEVVDGIIAKIIVKKNLNGIDEGLMKEVMADLHDSVSSFGLQGESSIQEIYLTLSAYEKTGDLAENTAKIVADALQS